MRTLRRMGMRSVAVYADADRDSLHVRTADKAISLGGVHPAETYLRIDKMIDACRASGAQAVHPGYGFLSENAEFAEACEAAGIVFIGPPASAMRAMGSKAEAKDLMQRHGVPLVPGYHGADQNPARLLDEAERIGFP